MSKSPAVNVLENTLKLQVEEYLMQRFGMESIHFEKYDWIKSNKAIWLAPKYCLDKLISTWNIERYGLRALKGKEFPYWPTTAFVQIFGRYATKGNIELPYEEAQKYLKLETVAKKLDFPHGAIMVSYKGNILGTALYHEESILSFYPKRLLGYFGIPQLRIDEIL